MLRMMGEALLTVLTVGAVVAFVIVLGSAGPADPAENYCGHGSGIERAYCANGDVLP